MTTDTYGESIRRDAALQRGVARGARLDSIDEILDLWLSGRREFPSDALSRDRSLVARIRKQAAGASG